MGFAWHQIVARPDGRKVMIVARRRDLLPYGVDGSSILATATSALTNRLGRLGWIVELRPYPKGRGHTLMVERFGNEADAIARAGRLAVEIPRGLFDPPDTPS